MVDDSNKTGRQWLETGKTVLNWRADQLPDDPKEPKIVDPFAQPESEKVPMVRPKAEAAKPAGGLAKKTMLGVAVPGRRPRSAPSAKSAVPSSKTTWPPPKEPRIEDIESLEDYDPTDMTGTIDTGDQLDRSFENASPMEVAVRNLPSETVGGTDAAEVEIVPGEPMDAFDADPEDIESALNSIAPPEPVPSLPPVSAPPPDPAPGEPSTGADPARPEAQEPSTLEMQITKERQAKLRAQMDEARARERTAAKASASPSTGVPSIVIAIEALKVARLMVRISSKSGPR